MKRIISLALMLALTFTFAACGSSDRAAETAEGSAAGTEPAATVIESEAPASSTPAATESAEPRPSPTAAVTEEPCPTDAPEATEAPEIPDEAVLTEILRVGLGDGDGELGIDMSVEGCAPEAFLVCGDEIAVLDSVKQRVCVYEEGTFIRSIDLTQAHAAIYGYSMARLGDRLFVLDTWTDIVFEFDYASGLIAESHSVPKQLVSNYSCNLFAENESVYIGAVGTGGKLFDLLDPDAEPVSKIKVDASWTTWRWSTPYTDGYNTISKEKTTYIYFIDSDSYGNAYFSVLYDIPGVEFICFENVLMRCSKSGEITGWAGFNGELNAKYPHRHTVVLGDGRVYEMLTTDTELIIYEIVFGRTYERRTDELREYFLSRYD